MPIQSLNLKLLQNIERLLASFFNEAGKRKLKDYHIHIYVQTRTKTRTQVQRQSYNPRDIPEANNFETRSPHKLKADAWDLFSSGTSCQNTDICLENLNYKKLQPNPQFFTAQALTCTNTATLQITIKSNKVKFLERIIVNMT